MPSTTRLGVLVEIEAGRGARGNAMYWKFVRASPIVRAKYLALGVTEEYRHQTGGKPIAVESYSEAEDQLDASYASGRLKLLF